MRIWFPPSCYRLERRRRPRARQRTPAFQAASNALALPKPCCRSPFAPDVALYAELAGNLVELFTDVFADALELAAERHCSGLLIPDTEMGGKFTAIAEVFHDKTTSYVFNRVQA